jgi:hypothetical protein
MQRKTKITIALIIGLFASGIVIGYTFGYMIGIKEKSTTTNPQSTIIYLNGAGVQNCTLNQDTYQFIGPFETISANGLNIVTYFQVLDTTNIDATITNYTATVGATYQYENIQIYVSEVSWTTSTTTLVVTA